MDERTKQDVEDVGCEDETQTPLQTETFARKHLRTHTHKHAVFYTWTLSTHTCSEVSLRIWRGMHLTCENSYIP